MYIRNLTKHDIPFNYGGKRYVFPGDSLTPIDENELPYRVLENLYGNHRLSKIEDKYIELDRASVGSNFDDFLKEEGILEEVEEKAKEKLEELAELTKEEKEEIVKNAELCDPKDCKDCGEEICANYIEGKEEEIEKFAENICIGGFIPVEGATELPCIAEVKEETKSSKKKK